MAAYQGQDAIVEALLRANPDLTIKDRNGHTALHVRNSGTAPLVWGEAGCCWEEKTQKNRWPDMCILFMQMHYTLTCTHRHAHTHT